MPRIGTRMQDAQDYVRANPGCSKLYVAERVGPKGSRNFGYRTVDRAIAAGLIAALPGKRKGTYSLYVPSEYR